MFRCFSSRLFFFFRFPKKPYVVYSVPSAMLYRQCNRIGIERIIYESHCYLNTVSTKTWLQSEGWKLSKIIRKNKNNTRGKCVLTCPEKYLSKLLGSGTETIKGDETLELLIIKSSIRQILLSLEEPYSSALSNHMIYSIRFYSLNASQNINCR